jgi:hypothetical protein
MYRIVSGRLRTFISRWRLPSTREALGSSGCGATRASFGIEDRPRLYIKNNSKRVRQV